MSWLVVLGWLRKVPREAWLVLAFALAVLWLRSHWIGVGEDRCRQAQVVAQVKALAKGQKAAQKAQEAATAVKIDVRQESENEAVQAREIVRYLPRTCPTQPDELRVIGRDAVEATRASVPAAKGRPNP